MAELLVKEKQFIRLNEELDRLTIRGAAGLEATAVLKADNRFNTYQKSKGPSTLLRKQGAGDGIAEITTNVTNIKELKTNTMTTGKLAGGETYRTSNGRKDEIHGSSTLASNLSQYRPKQTTCNESIRSQAYNRAGSSRIVPSNNNSAFAIKYRNTKFLESPSLEALLKEESSSLSCEKEASRIGSINSVAFEDGLSTGRHSQTSNHTVVSKRNISSEGLIKFLKSKIVILEEDHERMSQEMAKQKEMLTKALEYTHTLEQQRDQAKSKNNSLTEQITKSEKHLEEANKRLKQRSIEQIALNKELETAKRELKLLTQSTTNLEKRLFKANEDLQSVRNTLSLMKTAERDQNETARKETEAKEIQIKNLKKQRANLLNAYKKQLFLIDNLKRQNILLEQAKMLDFGEKEFSKVLDWNIKS